MANSKSLNWLDEADAQVRRLDALGLELKALGDLPGDIRDVGGDVEILLSLEEMQSDLARFETCHPYPPLAPFALRA